MIDELVLRVAGLVRAASDADSGFDYSVGMQPAWPACAALLLSAAVPLRAQGGTGDAGGSDSQDIIDPEIVVTAGGPVPRGVVPERSLDPDRMAAYGQSRVGDLLADVATEDGEDEDPILLVDGRPASELGDITDFPVEAIARVDVLPRGSGVRFGVSSGRRVYNVVLRPRFRSETVAVAGRLATDGGWSGRSGEFAITRVKNSDRLNIALRLRDEGALLESERDVVQPAPDLAYDLRGNIIADPRGSSAEIDPALTALAGTLVTVAAIPTDISRPTLEDFAAGANRPNMTALGRFRTLTPDSREHVLSLSMGHRLTSWLTSSLSAQLTHSREVALLGLRSGLFVLPAGSPFSPFSRDVAVAAYDADPLRQRSQSTSGSATMALNADVGSWRLSLAGRYERIDRSIRSDRQDGASTAVVLDDPTLDPFAGILGDLLPEVTDIGRSRSDFGEAKLTATGALVELPAGPVQNTTNLAITGIELIARNRSAEARTGRVLDRTQFSAQTSLEIPLASRRNKFLPAVGELTANLEYGHADVSDAVSLRRYGYGLAWEPTDWLRIYGFANHLRTPPSLRLLGDPVIVTPGVRYFDFLRGETIDVTQVTGGNAALLPEHFRTRRLALTFTPLDAINLRVNSAYLHARSRDFVSSLPPASAPILLAFPERFPRDANGRLTTVDIRPVNFARRIREQIQSGLSFSIPLGNGPDAGAPASRTEDDGTSAPESSSREEETAGATTEPSTPQAPRPWLLFSATHTLNLSDAVLIRPGVPIVDLLHGGAIGTSGSRPRHLIEAHLAYAHRGLGARVTGTWRSRSSLDVGQDGSTDRLRFGSVATFDLRAYAELRRLFPETNWLKGARVSLTIANIANERQKVVDAAGDTPLRYQKAYQNPLGRTVEVEIRKLF